MLPFESGAMMNRFFSRVSPATASGHGRNRCHARLSVSVSVSDSPLMPKSTRILSRIIRCRRIELGPRQLTGSHAVHARAVPGAPGVGELRPVHRQTLPPRQLLHFLRHRCAPVDDGAEGVEHERLDRGHLSIRPPAALSQSRRDRAVGCEARRQLLPPRLPVETCDVKMKRKDGA